MHSIALESIIGSECYGTNEVLRIEEDAYGRVLFAFFGAYIYTEFSEQEDVLAIVIAQKTDSNFVYYYDFMNALAVVTIHQLYKGLTFNLLESYFDEEDF